jgi:hypothetical protein
MHNLLTKLLQKRGINDTRDLSKEEQKTFDDWQKVLSKEELTLPDVKDFCRNQVGIIEQKWADYNLDQEKKNNLIPYHTVYKAILRAIDSPKETRSALEKNLQQLINQ